MKTLKEKIEVMQAALDGEKIECIGLGKPQDKWEEIRYTTSLIWDWLNEDYRVKPKPLEFWVKIYKNATMVCDIKSNPNNCETHGGGKYLKTIKVREVLDENI